MSAFPFHTIESAPAEARPLLQQAQSTMGFVPNLFGYLAEAPASLEAYFSLTSLLGKSSLSEQQQQVVLLAASVANRCEFCVAAHSMGARQAAGVAPEVVQALREEREPADPVLGPLARFTRQVVAQRGNVEEAQVQAFLDAGYTHAQVLEVVLGVALKTLSNYTNHIAGTTTNKELAAEAWQAPG